MQGALGVATTPTKELPYYFFGTAPDTPYSPPSLVTYESLLRQKQTHVTTQKATQMTTPTIAMITINASAFSASVGVSTNADVGGVCKPLEVGVVRYWMAY